MAISNSGPYVLPFERPVVSLRDVTEVVLGFGAIVAVLWLPTREQLIFGPIALLAPLALVLLRHPSWDDVGSGWRGIIRAWWILPASVAVAILGVKLAQAFGTYHPLYEADLKHVGGYVVWTIYQQFLLQDYFMPRLTRALNSEVAIAVAGVLFAVAHLPNLTLTLATLVWGVVSCLLFRRYKSVYILGLAQGLLGLCFAVCVPEAMHHHMRVGLGYSGYHAASKMP